MPQDVQAGHSSLFGGMSSAFQPSDIEENQYAKGINITCRGGTTKTRPPVHKLNLSFNHDRDEVRFPAGKFQGAKVYVSSVGTFIVTVISGNVYLIDPISSEVTNQSLLIGPLNQFVDRCYFEQAERFMIIQDGFNRPMILDGLSIRKSDTPNKEVPVGTLMAYGHGRLFIKTGPTQFKAGDIFLPNDADSLLKFTETEYLNGGGAFQLPAILGDIVSLNISHVMGTSTGNGPLLAYGENGIASYRVFEPRVIWQNIDIGRIEMIGQGARAHDAIITVNEDMMFRTSNGLRSYRLLREQSQSQRKYTNLSADVSVFEDQETAHLVHLSSAIFHNDRLLYTIVADRIEATDTFGEQIDDFRFRGIASLDFSTFNGLTSVGAGKSAAYDGVWTGMNPTFLIQGYFDEKDRAYVFGKTDEGLNILYRIGDIPDMDNGDVPINCRLYTQGHFFSTTTARRERTEFPFISKTLDRAGAWVRFFEGEVDLKLSVKTDDRTAFREISVSKLRAGRVKFNPPADDTVTIGLPQARPKILFPAFQKECDEEVTGQTLLTGYEFQFLIEWDGVLELSKFVCLADLDDIKSFPACENLSETKFRTELARSDFDYNSEKGLVVA